MKSRASQTPASSAAAREWTFLTNHAHVLITIAAHPSLALREISLIVGITERGVQKIVADLEEAGFLGRVKVGRRNEYRLHLEQSLRHPVEQHRTIGDIVKLLYPNLEILKNPKRQTRKRES